MPADRTRRFTSNLWYLVAGTALALVFWQSPLLYPVKLFVVLLHELSHALAALLTGGEVLRMDIGSDLGGSAVTRGGWPWLIVSSGYLGSMVFGNLLLLLSLRPGREKLLALGTAALIALATIVFVRNLFGVAFGLAFSVALLASARWLPVRWLGLGLQLLGMLSSLYALFDVREDLLTLEHRVTDAAILSDMTGIPAIVWGLLWTVTAVVFFFLTLRRGLAAAGRRNAPIQP